MDSVNTRVDTEKQLLLTYTSRRFVFEIQNVE